MLPISIGAGILAMLVAVCASAQIGRSPAGATPAGVAGTPSSVVGTPPSLFGAPATGAGASTGSTIVTPTAPARPIVGPAPSLSTDMTLIVPPPTVPFLLPVVPSTPTVPSDSFRGCPNNATLC
jgi:hypothetical protein